MNDNITEINKDTFWKLIQSAKETCGQDMDAMMDFLKDRLVSMGPEQAQNFHDILHAYEKACGKTLPYVIDPRRPGDIAECYADPAKALNEMGWQAQYGIEEMCASSWKWQSMNPNGYKG